MNVFADWAPTRRSRSSSTTLRWRRETYPRGRRRPGPPRCTTPGQRFQVGQQRRRDAALRLSGGGRRVPPDGGDDSVGYAFQGTTRTFIPKAGAPSDQLYDDYNSGYYPTLASHSATIQYEDDKERSHGERVHVHLRPRGEYRLHRGVPGTSATTGSSRTRPTAAPWKRPRRWRW